jgi:translation initiation factor 3 subunit K
MTKEAQPQVSYTVEKLVEVNPYNPDILSDLENYVNEQVSFSFLASNPQLCL